MSEDRDAVIEAIARLREAGDNAIEAFGGLVVATLDEIAAIVGGVDLPPITVPLRPGWKTILNGPFLTDADVADYGNRGSLRFDAFRDMFDRHFDDVDGQVLHEWNAGTVRNFTAANHTRLTANLLGAPPEGLGAKEASTSIHSILAFPTSKRIAIEWSMGFNGLAGKPWPTGWTGKLLGLAAAQEGEKLAGGHYSSPNVSTCRLTWDAWKYKHEPFWGVYNYVQPDTRMDGREDWVNQGFTRLHKLKDVAPIKSNHPYTARIEADIEERWMRYFIDGEEVWFRDDYKFVADDSTSLWSHIYFSLMYGGDGPDYGPKELDQVTPSAGFIDIWDVKVQVGV